MRALSGSVLVPILVLGVLGCGSADPNPVVVRVGPSQISERTVGHWASAIARGAIVADVADAEQSPIRQALAFLIYSHWLIGEASRVGLSPSRQQLERLVRTQEQSMPNGRTEFLDMLATSGERLADVEFEARARWTARRLMATFDAAAEKRARVAVSDAAVARFYRSHAARYHLRERRYYDLIERLPSKADAARLVKRLGSGKRFAARASKEQPFRPRTFAGLPGQGVVYRAVFAAKVGVLTGPLPLQGAYALFVLRRIEPPRVQPLSDVRWEIERYLLDAAERRARAQVIDGFHARWISQTNCHKGYVVQKCRQYTGARMPEEDPLASF